MRQLRRSVCGEHAPNLTALQLSQPALFVCSYACTGGGGSTIVQLILLPHGHTVYYTLVYAS